MARATKKDSAPVREELAAVESAQLRTFLSDLNYLMRARYSAIAVKTAEEARATAALRTLHGIERHRSKALFTWSVCAGLRQVAGPRYTESRTTASWEEPTAVPKTEQFMAALSFAQGRMAAQPGERAIYVFYDAAPYLAAPQAVRLLREVAQSARDCIVNLLFVGAAWPEIADLEHDVTVVSLPLPDEADMRAIVKRRVGYFRDHPTDEVQIAMDQETEDRVVAALLGLTELEAEGLLARVIVTCRGLGAPAVPIILDAKKEAIRKSGALQYTPAAPLESMGGYHNLHRLLKEAAATFSPAARAAHVEPHKGVLLVGLPGCGKDLFKKVASSVLGRPLIDMDLGQVIGAGGGILGSAEREIHRALELASTMGGILGISEFEKGVGGLASSNRTDGGTTARTIGRLLNWMNDQEGVFVVATANDVRQLAPEQIRQGRFGAIVFVDLPEPADRREIFAVHLGKRGQDVESYDLGALARVTDGFSGAEIEACCKQALLDAFMDGARPLVQEDLLRAAGGIQPTSRVRREEVEELREWAREHMAISAQAAPEGPARLAMVRGGTALEL